MGQLLLFPKQLVGGSRLLQSVQIRMDQGLGLLAPSGAAKNQIVRPGSQAKSSSQVVRGDAIQPAAPAQSSPGADARRPGATGSGAPAISPPAVPPPHKPTPPLKTTGPPQPVAPICTDPDGSRFGVVGTIRGGKKPGGQARWSSQIVKPGRQGRRNMASRPCSAISSLRRQASWGHRLRRSGHSTASSAPSPWANSSSSQNNWSAAAGCSNRHHEGRQKNQVVRPGGQARSSRVAQPGSSSQAVRGGATWPGALARPSPA